MNELQYKIKLFDDFISDSDERNRFVLKEKYSEYVLEKASEYSVLIHTSWVSELIHKKSIIYLKYGVLKRFILILTYFERIIRIAPATRVDPLDFEEVCQFNANLNSLLISLTGLIDCAMWVFVYENSKTEMKLEDKLYCSPRCFEENKTLIKLNDIFFKILKVNKVFSDKILDYKDWYRELSGKRNFVAHGVPFRISDPHIDLSSKPLKERYDKKIHQAFLTKDRIYLKTLQYEASKIGVFQPTYIGFTGKKEITYNLYESIPEHIVKTINLATLILNTALLDSRLTNQEK